MTHRIILQADKNIPPEDYHLLVATYQGLIDGSIQ
jgi:hypothetical protein